MKSLLHKALLCEVILRGVGLKDPDDASHGEALASQSNALPDEWFAARTEADSGAHRALLAAVFRPPMRWGGSR